MWKVRGLLADGALHWLARSYHSPTGIQIETRVVSFDICDQTFRNTSLSDKRFLNGFISDLGVWEGKPCILIEHEKIAFTVWTMKGYTWIKHFNITEKISNGMTCNWKPIQMFQNGEILFRCYLHKELVSYDPKLQSASVLKISDLSNPCLFEPYIGALVSLNSGTFVG
ncbi:hypothetical protein MKX01_014626 [Papaver californicum]|nr:hypothetical protein MKX01_014626 [Papaver californicum]